MNFCSNCGAKNSSNSNFCPSCGQSLSNSASSSNNALKVGASQKNEQPPLIDLLLWGKTEGQ